MNPLRTIHERFSQLLHEFAKFGIVGAANVIVNFAIVNLLWFLWGDRGTLTAVVIATVVTTLLSYLANRHWTWRHRARSGMAREYFLFFVLNGIGLLIQTLLVGFAKYTLGMENQIAYNIAYGIGLATATVFRFWSYKKWVFLPPELPPVDPHTGLPEPEPEPDRRREPRHEKARPSVTRGR